MGIARAMIVGLLGFSSLTGCEASVRSSPEAATPRAETLPRTGGPKASGLSVPSGTVGPFLSATKAGWLAAWAEPRPEGGARWVAETFAPNGRPSGRPTRLAEASAGLDLVRFRSIQAEAHLLLASHAVGDRHRLSALAIAANGTLLGGPNPLGNAAHRIVWIDVAPGASGAVVTWAEERATRAHLFARRVDAAGRAIGPQAHLHSNARAWQLLGVAGGAVLGVVTVDGNVETIHIDPQGVASTPRVVADHHSAEPDLDLAVLGDDVVIAFSDRRVLEPHLFSAVLSSDGHLRSDARLMRQPNGAQSLVALASGPPGTYVLWQDFAQEPSQYRIARVDVQGRAPGPSIRIPPSSANQMEWNLSRSGVPVLAASEAGLTVFAPACTEGTHCDTSTASMLVELAADLSHRSSYSWFELGKAPDLVWDFQCRPSGCGALTAYYTDPARVIVKTTDTPGEPVAGFDAIPSPVTTENAAVALQAVISTPELAAVDSRSFADGTLVAWLSAFDPNLPYEIPSSPAPDGRRAPVRAQLKTQWLAKTREARESPADPSEQRSVSIRARSVAGINLVNTARHALLTWTAVDNGQPQVFNTLLDPRGRKHRQEMLTRQSGEVLDVNAIPWKTGWLVAWIRELGGATHTYVARLGETLGRMSADVRLSSGQGLQSMVELGATAGGLWAAVAEVQSTGETLAWFRLDPTTLLPKTNVAPSANPFGEETDWQRTNPRVRPWGNGLAVAWLEHKAEQSQLALAQLDADGRLVAKQRVPLPARGVALQIACPNACHVAISAETTADRVPSAGGLWAVTVSSAEPKSATQRGDLLSPQLVAHLTAPLALRVAPTVTQTGLLYFDHSPGANPSAVGDGLGNTATDSALHESWISW